MANVYLVVARAPTGLNKLLVLKAIREDLALQPDLLAMFLDEARLSARLAHKNVVQTIEVSELRGRPVIVMEYLDGQALSNVLYRPECRDFTLAMRLRVISDVLEGLEYIHNLGDFDGTPLQLVHRDVSPHNVFVTYDGQVKLLDFGIAKGLISRVRTSTDVIKGKIRYMAPEQMSGEGVDRRADVFSVGVILWEIATGKRIWHGRSEVNVMHAVLNEGVPSPSSVEPSVSPDLNAVCVRALARSPGDRYQSAAEFQRAIEDLLEGMGSRIAPRDMGKCLATAFAESRSRTQEVIEAELKKSEGSSEISGERFAFPSTLVSLAAETESGSVEPVETPQPPRRGWAALAAALAVGAAAGGTLILHRSSPADSASSGPATSGNKARTTASTSDEAPPPEAVPVPGPSPSPSARTVHLQLTTSPPNAALFLDDARLDNPFDGTYPADGTRHVLRAVSAGYAPATADIVLDRDVALVLPLAAARTSASVRRTPAIAAPPVPSTPAPETSAAPTSRVDCTPPFYFDAQGIKRLKQECL